MKLKINVQKTGNRSEGRSVAGLDTGDVFHGQIDGQAEGLYLKLSEGYIQLDADLPFRALPSYRASGEPRVVTNYRSAKATLNVGE